MKIKLRFMQDQHLMKAETEAEIKEIRIGENLVNESDEIVQLCFMSDFTSGIIELKVHEFEKLLDSAKNKLEYAREKRKILA